MAREASYRFVGDTAETLGSGRPVAPGEFVDLADEDLRDYINETLVHDGKLIPVNDQAQKQVSLAKARMTRRINNEVEVAEEEAALVEGNADQSKEG